MQDERSWDRFPELDQWNERSTFALQTTRPFCALGRSCKIWRSVSSWRHKHISVLNWSFDAKYFKEPVQTSLFSCIYQTQSLPLSIQWDRHSSPVYLIWDNPWVKLNWVWPVKFEVWSIRRTCIIWVDVDCV